MNKKAFLVNSGKCSNLEEGAVYTAFKERIYAVTHKDQFIRLYILDEKELRWELYMQQEVELELESVATFTTFGDEMAIIFESSSDNLDHIYKFNPELKTLTFFKTTRNMDAYLFIPEHIYR